MFVGFKFYSFQIIRTDGGEALILAFFSRLRRSRAPFYFTLSFFHRALEFSMYKSFISIKFIPNNLIDFVTIVNVIIVYFIFDILLLVYKKVTDFFIFF